MAKEIKVSDDKRTNEQSLIPGGSTVKTVLKNGQSRVYDKVKNHKAYAEKIAKDDKVVEIWVNDTLYWKR